MGKYVIRDAKILLNGYDLSGDHNQVGLTVTREEKEATVFGKVGVQRLAGLQSFEFSGSGFFEAGTGKVDAVVFPVGTTNQEVTILPQGSSVASKGFISQANTFEYAPGGSVGDVMGFTFAGRGEGTVLVEGNVLASGAKSTSGAGTALNLGAIASGRKGYATLHCTEAPTAAMNVIIQSDFTSGFGTPVTRIAFTQIGSIVTSEWKATTAATTDLWWRARWIPTVAPDSATIYVTFGISYL